MKEKIMSGILSPVEAAAVSGILSPVEAATLTIPPILRFLCGVHVAREVKQGDSGTSAPVSDSNACLSWDPEQAHRHLCAILYQKTHMAMTVFTSSTRLRVK